MTIPVTEGAKPHHLCADRMSALQTAQVVGKEEYMGEATKLYTCQTHLKQSERVTVSGEITGYTNCVAIEPVEHSVEAVKPLSQSDSDRLDRAAKAIANCAKKFGHRCYL